MKGVERSAQGKPAAPPELFFFGSKYISGWYQERILNPDRL